MTKGRPLHPAAGGCSLLWRNPSPSLLPFFARQPPPPPLILAFSLSCSAVRVGEGDLHPAISCHGNSCAGRRKLMLLLASSLGFAVFPTSLAFPSLAEEAVEAGEDEPLESYIDREEGFTLLRPSAWPKVDKAGAMALFVDEGNKNNSAGVVVNPVRLSSLRDFGTPEFVADKLIQAERRKESTKDAQMVRVSERAGRGQLPVYEFEYTVDSSRGGPKRIFSAAFVNDKKLYLLNISHSDSSVSPLDSRTRTLLEQVLRSFDAF